MLLSTRWVEHQLLTLEYMDIDQFSFDHSSFVRMLVWTECKMSTVEGFTCGPAGHERSTQVSEMNGTPGCLFLHVTQFSDL